MNKILRWLIALGLLLAVLLAAYGSPAWAGPSPTKAGVSAALPAQSGFPGSTYQGTVKPPPPDVEGCGPADYPLGGAAVIKASGLPSEYCVAGNLKPPFAKGRLPKDAGQFLGDVVLVRYYKDGDLQSELPPGTSGVEVCFAVPPGTTQVTIYFYDFYGPQLGRADGQPDWVPLETTVEDGVACAPAMASGAYGLVGP